MPVENPKNHPWLPKAEEIAKAIAILEGVKKVVPFAPTVDLGADHKLHFSANSFIVPIKQSGQIQRLAALVHDDAVEHVVRCQIEQIMDPDNHPSSRGLRTSRRGRRSAVISRNDPADEPGLDPQTFITDHDEASPPEPPEEVDEVLNASEMRDESFDNDGDLEEEVEPDVLNETSSPLTNDTPGKSTATSNRSDGGDKTTAPKLERGGTMAAKKKAAKKAATKSAITSTDEALAYLASLGRGTKFEIKNPRQALRDGGAPEMRINNLITCLQQRGSLSKSHGSGEDKSFTFYREPLKNGNRRASTTNGSSAPRRGQRAASATPEQVRAFFRQMLDLRRELAARGVVVEGELDMKFTFDDGGVEDVIHAKI